MTVATPQAPTRLGRFELRRVLGRGAQAVVWLAHDPRLDRDVALKIPVAQMDQGAVKEWLQEARAVSRLTHPNIVPVFEADELGRQPYLVFEYVDGPTLSELLRRRGALPAAEAAGLMLGVLDGLVAAHAQGIVHRDLKPSNILMGSDGRPRVMDFGIAARTGTADSSIVGTPGYISPEAARGEAPHPAMDVFAAGMLFGEMLAGAPLLRERDPMRALRRVQDEDFSLPADVQVDDVLRGIVQRAVSRDRSLRFENAVALREALSQWLQPAGEAAESASSGTLNFLMRRMRHKTDFPAMSDSVSRIQRVATSESVSLASLSAEILKDVALTNKLLRVVNTAHFGQAGSGRVSTVSRAVALVGFAGIRNMALSLVLLEHMKDKSHAAQLKEEFVRSLMAGMLAAELTPAVRESEEAFLSSMFQNLGRLLTEYYFPEEAEQIRQVAVGETPAAREAAAMRVLGIGFEELGVGIARVWGLPDSMQKAMRAPEGAVPTRPADSGTERFRWLGRAANSLTDSLMTGGKAVAQTAGTYAGVLGMEAKDILAAAENARKRLSELTDAMGLRVAPGTPARRLLQPADSTNAAPQHDTITDRPPASETLSSGIQDITNSMVADDCKLNDILRMVLETMFRALDFRSVVLCLRDPKTEMMTGRFGLGTNADAISRALRIPLKAASTGDLFAAICAKNADTLIQDATAGTIAQRLPAWYREGVNAPSFLLLPMSMKSAPFGLIYADKTVAGSISLGEKELALLRTLRNQAVMAFKQAA